MTIRKSLRGSKGLHAALFGLALFGAASTSSYGQDGPTLSGLSKDDTTYYLELQQVIAKPDLEHSRAFNAETGVRGVDFGYDESASTRLIFGFVKPTTGMGFRARYWGFEDESDSPFGTDSNGLITTDAITVLAGGGLEDVDTLTVQHSLDTQVLDLEYTKRFESTTGSFGLRTAIFDQSFDVDSDEGALNADLDFLGFGPTASIEGNYQIKDTDFSVFTAARVSALVGRRDLSSNNNASNVNGGLDPISDDTWQLAYNAEFQVGIEWRPKTFEDVGFFTRAGIEYQLWGNIGNLNEISSPLLDDTFDDPTSSTSDSYDGDIDFIGFFISAGVEF